MDKLKMHTPNRADENFGKLSQLFPNAVTEALDENGELVRAIDKDILMQEINTKVVEGNEERYQFTWPDKKNSMLLANAPIAKTLRPVREDESTETGADSSGKPYRSSGSVNFDTTENLYIEGDNLEVLKLLQETYLHKIDVIYIDPPYNTGRNLIYKNDFSVSADEYLKNSGQLDDEDNFLVQNSESNGRFHTDWLNMIYVRLKIAKQLLSSNGIIILTIDDCEIETVTMVMNEVFGEINHLATIIVKNNPSGRSTVSGASISHEYALFYSANPFTKMGRLQRSEKQVSRYKEFDEFGFFEWVNFRKHGGYREDAPTMFYPIFIKKDCSSFRIPDMIWDETAKRYSTIEKRCTDEIVSLPIDENNRDRRWKWGLDRALISKNEMTVKKDRHGKPAIYIKSRMKHEGMLPLTVWDEAKYSSTEYGTNFLTNLMGKKYFDYPKSIYAVLDCLRVANAHKNAIILDFFSGSSTTAHAVMQLNAEDGGNRKFIMVQLPEETDKKSEAYKAGYKNICEIGKERIRKAGTLIQIENEGWKSVPFARLDGSKVGDYTEAKIVEIVDYNDGKGPIEIVDISKNIDTGFRVLKVDSTNMKDVYYNPDDIDASMFDTLTDNIKEDRSPEDLLFQVMLDLGILLSSPISIHNSQFGTQNYSYFDVAEGYLIACFDENINEEIITEIAKKEPYYFVMRDSSMANDSVATNFEQIFQSISPNTVRKIL